MVSRRDVPGRASHAKSSSYCDSVHTLMLFSPPSGTTPLAEDAEPSPRQQSSPRSPPRPRSKPSPLKILVRAFNACRRGRNNNARAAKDDSSPSSSSTPRAASPIPTMSAHEAAAIRRILAVPSQHSLTFASNSSSTTSLPFTPRPSNSPSESVSSRASSSTYYTAASFVESPYPSVRRTLTAPAQHPYALAAPVYE